MISAQSLWKKALEQIRRDMTEISYNTWIKDLYPVAVSGGALVLETQGEAYKTTLERIYKNSITQAVNSNGQSGLDILFIIPEDRSKYEIEEKENEPAGQFNLSPKYTFDTFVIGKSNSFAHAAAIAVAENPATAYNPFFIYGGVGLGKTHLMHAIGQHFIKLNPDKKIAYITSESFTNEFIQSLRDNKTQEFREKYRSVDLLMVDDIQFIAGKDSTQEEVFHTFNTLKLANKQIVITSDRPPKEIGLMERIYSRFAGGLVADVQIPDFETRIAILKKKAYAENIEISDDILSFIAENLVSNIRELEGSLNRVTAYSLLTKEPLSLDLAKASLKDIIQDSGQKTVTPALIMQIVADYYDIEVKDLLSKRKDREISVPRQVSMYLIRKYTDLSLPNIGKMFGGRDHTTVKYACDKMNQDISNNYSLETTVDNIVKRFIV